MSKEFAKAEGKRIVITNAQSRQIGRMYKSILDDIDSRMKFLQTKDNVSSILRLQYLQELQKQISKNLEAIDNELYKTIQSNMESVATKVVEDNQKLLAQIGYSDKLSSVAYSYVPQDIVNELISGKLYEGKWTLSKAIWNDNALQNKDLETIVAKGIAANKSTFEIAKDLEKYVNPSAKKDWEWSKVYPGVRKKIDYNAQRLARTMVSHAYEESFVRTTKKNPFIESYRWLTSNSDRVCPLCISRAEDDQYGLGAGIFPKDQLPLDHPNGMCTFETVITKSYDQIADDLADWVLGKGNEEANLAFDDFAKDLGFDIKPKQFAFNEAQKKYLEPLGFTPGNMPKSFDEWSHKISYDMGGQILKSMGTNWLDPHPYQQLMKYYQNNLAQLQATVIKKQMVSQAKTGIITDGASFAAKYGKSKGKKFNYWYTKLDSEAKEIAKQLKESSGLTWQQWYEQNIYNGTAQATKEVVQKAGSAVEVVQKTVSAMPQDWLARAERQTQSMMLQMEKEAFKKLSAEEKRGIKKYTGSAYQEINAYLRHRAAGKTEDEAIKLSEIDSGQMKALKNARSGLQKMKLEKDLILRRGTNLGDLAGFMDGDFKSNKRELERMSIDELNQRFSGTIGTYAGFTSTSSSYKRGFPGDVEIIFNAPAGIQASSIMGISQYGTEEGETLLNAGTQVMIEKIEKSDGHKGSSIRVFMTILGNVN